MTGQPDRQWPAWHGWGAAGLDALRALCPKGPAYRKLLLRDLALTSSRCRPNGVRRSWPLLAQVRSRLPLPSRSGFFVRLRYPRRRGYSLWSPSFRAGRSASQDLRETPNAWIWSSSSELSGLSIRCRLRSNTETADANDPTIRSTRTFAAPPDDWGDERLVMDADQASGRSLRDRGAPDHTIAVKTAVSDSPSRSPP